MPSNVVCPECYSPYLATEVVATAKVNRDFNWELEFVQANELQDAISNPNTVVECEHCGWSGSYSELITIKGSGLEGIQHDTGESYVSEALSDVQQLPNTFGKPEPTFDIGTVILDDKEEYVIIAKANIKVIRANFYNGRMNWVHAPSTLYTLTPVNQDLYPNGKFVSLTETNLRNAYLQGGIKIIKQ